MDMCSGTASAGGLVSTIITAARQFSISNRADGVACAVRYCAALLVIALLRYWQCLSSLVTLYSPMLRRMRARVYSEEYEEHLLDSAHSWLDGSRWKVNKES